MNDEITQGQNIREMVEKEFGFDNLSDEKQQELVLKMTESVIKRVLVEAYIKLSDSKKQEFDKMMENTGTFDPGKAEEFLRTNVREYDDVVKEAMEELRKHIS
ncbi:MAG: hypothetical protein ACD_15C00109G0001 [uncultured bacterium]|nr:MAG: hypothetical protein ACD_15C00109G0001 [uncultured bacterium]HCU70450.1 hypothetical protein [Candidatus Moranbacteria bacterium]